MAEALVDLAFNLVLFVFNDIHMCSQTQFRDCKIPIITPEHNFLLTLNQ